MKIVSQSLAKIDGMDLATGKPVYVDDLLREEALCVKLLRSPHAFARVKHIDAERAKALAGVECVLTYKDMPQIRYTIAAESYPETSPYDRLIMDSIVRYIGDPVAIVGAMDEKTALKALKLIKIEYELLPAVLDLEQAEGNSSIVHPEKDDFTNFEIGRDAENNVVTSFTKLAGDVERELPGCEAVTEETYYTQAQAHSMMETHRAFSCLGSRGKLTIVSSIQSAFHVQRQVAKALGMPQGRIRVIKPRVGGGFGGKNIALVEPYCALVTLKTGKPAKIVLSRQECYTATNTRHAMRVKACLGADRDGLVKVIDMDALSDSGAYGEHAPDVLTVACNNVLPIYGTQKAIRFRAKAVYTNRVPAGAFRGFGAPQTNFALESAINELAAELNMDPYELRLKNIIRLGQTHPFLAGEKDGRFAEITSTTLQECMDRGRELIGWEQKYPRVKISENRVRAVGMSIAMHGSGIANLDTASAEIRLNYDGTYTLLIGAADLGTGSDTILMQMAAEVLGAKTENISVLSADTELTPYDKGAFASSTTYVTGNAVIKAAEKLKMHILRDAAVLFGKTGEELELEGEFLRTADGSWEKSLLEVAQKFLSMDGMQQLSASATYGGTTSPPPFVAGFAEVEVDLETGKVTPVNYAAVIDCGTVINPNLARIQAEGGLVQGIGMALFEEVHYGGDGKLYTDSLMQYKIPSRRDVGKITVEFIPSYEPTGPFGAKSIGEVVFHTPLASIADAVFNASGVRIRKLPITPEAVLTGIWEKNGLQADGRR